MSTSIPVDSGHGSSSEENQALFEAAKNQEFKPVAYATGLASQQMDVRLVAQFYDATRIIEDVLQLISVTKWNKQQCKRIAERYSAIAKRLKSMFGDGNTIDIDNASISGSIIEVWSGLIDVLEKGKSLVSDCGDESQAITNIISRTENSEEFEEHHEELDAVVTKLGLQRTGDAVEFTSEMEKINILNADAEEDKKEIPKILSQMPNVNHKVAKVVSERVEGPVETKNLLKTDKSVPLPSYLTIPLSEIEWTKLVSEYERLSKQDPEHEVGWAFVYFGQWLGYKFAMKVFNCREKENGDPAAWNQSQLLMEARSLVELQHPHVTRLVGYGQDANFSVFVMELMDGDLRKFIKARVKQKSDKPFKDSEALNVITQIAKGMLYIHSKGYTHGDLKCSNILVKNRGNQYLDIKIGDLRGSQKCGQWDSKAFEQASKTRRPRWTAPEFIDYDGQKEHSWESLKKLDIYSFGMTCYEIVTGKLPFDGIHGKDAEPILKRMIKEGKRPVLPESLDADLKALITSCWDTNPERRPPGFEVICQLLDDMKPKTQDCSLMLNQFVSGEESKLVQHQGIERPTKSSEILKPEDLNIPECLKIDPKQLIRGERIGEGASSTVYKTTWLHSIYAAKVFKPKVKSFAQPVQEELNSLMKVSRHPCIAQLIGFSADPLNGECSIIMEYIDGNLEQLIDTRMKKRKVANRTGPFNDHEEFCIISEIALGMAYVHSRRLVHGDLKSNNVLAQEHSGIVNVKIVDFGLSQLEDSLELSDSQPKPTRMRYYSNRGTLHYRAPEMIKREYHIGDPVKLGLPHPDQEPDFQALKAIDVYSFAVTCYQVLTGYRLPPQNRLVNNYSVKDYSDKVIRENLRPPWPAHYPNSKLWPELKELVESCWVLVPEDRLTFDQICVRLWKIKNSN